MKRDQKKGGNLVRGASTFNVYSSIAQKDESDSILNKAQAATKRLEALLSVTDTALTYLTLDDLLRELLNRIREIMAVDNVAILLTNEDGQYLTVRAALGLEEEVAAIVDRLVIVRRNMQRRIPLEAVARRRVVVFLGTNRFRLAGFQVAPR